MPRPKAVEGKSVTIPSYRVSQAELLKAQRKAKRRKTVFSEVLRKFIKAYGNGEVTI